MAVIRMQDVELGGRRVLIREDLNVPVKDGIVTSDARIRAALPTIRAALEANAAVMLMSHLGRASRMRSTRSRPLPGASVNCSAWTCRSSATGSTVST